MDEHRKRLAEEITRLEATELGTDEFRAAVAVVEERLQAIEREEARARGDRAVRESERLRPVNQILGGATAALGLIAAVLTSKWLLIFLLPVVAVGVLLVLRPADHTRMRLAGGAAGLVVAVLCLIFGGAFGG